MRKQLLLPLQLVVVLLCCYLWFGMTTVQTTIVPNAASHAIKQVLIEQTLVSPMSTSSQIVTSAAFANGAANRAPFRPRIHPLIELNVSADKTPVECFDVNGNPAQTPSWGDILFSRLHFRYSEIQEIVSSDPWQVLVGWIPEKFMGPQKAGRKANGDVMLPPTKGRNPRTYLEEYNASFHIVVQGQFKYHFQVVHRNALAVCIRERIHLFQLFCAPRGQQAPIPLYYCPCRHCRESATRVSTETLSKKFPRFALRVLNAESQYAPLIPADTPNSPAVSQCIDATSAPWLVDRAIVFSYEGLANDLDRLLEVQADANKIVIVSIFNKFWVDHLHNYVFSLVTRARMTNFIVATMDSEGLEVCQQNRLPCFDASAFAEFEDSIDASGGHVRKVTEAMSWIKPRLAVALLSRGYGFFLTDLDLSWNKNPMRDILMSRYDIVHQCDTSNKFSINSGFYFARPIARTISFFKNLMLFTPSENSDQTAMKLFARYDHTHGASHMCLPKWAYNMKCNYKVEGSVKVIHGVETFKWVPFDRNREKFFWTILHATCLSGAHAKMLYLRTMNAWFLDDLDFKTANASGGKYCLTLRSGKEVQQPSVIRTLHSPKYVSGIDVKFLQERH